MFSNTDKFKVEAFDHLEFFVGDAVTATRVLKFGLGMCVRAMMLMLEWCWSGGGQVLDANVH